MNPKLCFIDTETTGTDVNVHGLIQVAGILTTWDPTTRLFTELERFDLRMKPFPADRVEASALAVNGVTEEQLAELPAPGNQYRALVALLGKHISKFNRLDKAWFVGYNARFDSDFIRRWFEKCGDVYYGSWFWYPPIDVTNLAAIRFLQNRQTLPNFKLSTVADALGIKPEGELHDAMTDIKLTQAIFTKLLNPPEAAQ